MKEFTYSITDTDGIHARPAGKLVKEAANYQSEITIHIDQRTGDAKRIFSIMGLGIRYGQTITVAARGSDEEEAIAAMEKFFKENL